MKQKTSLPLVHCRQILLKKMLQLFQRKNSQHKCDLIMNDELFRFDAFFWGNEFGCFRVISFLFKINLRLD